MATRKPAILYSQEYCGGEIGLLESISQVHDGYILGAMNEFQDNAIEAKAKNQWITLEEDDNFGGERVLSFLDDGNGLDKRAWSRLLSFGRKDKDKDNNYGVGCKSGSFSIGKNVLVFSKGREGGEPLWGVSFFRQACPHTEIHVDHPCSACGKWREDFKPPVIFWRGNGRAITEANYEASGCGGAAQGSNAVQLSSEGVEEILKDIFRHSFIKSLRKIQQQFEKIRSDTGTLVLIYELEKGKAGKTLEEDRDQDQNPDIRVVGMNETPYMRVNRKFKSGSDVTIDYSLRAQTELLLKFMSPKGGGSRIKFHIQGAEVKPWSVEDMCHYGEMQTLDFGLDAKAEVVSFEEGAVKVGYRLGFSPEAYGRGLGGLFFYYDKGNGDPLRLVESYQTGTIRPDVVRGIIGVVVIKHDSKSAKRHIIMDYGKQKLINGKHQELDFLKKMKSVCSEGMSEFKSPSLAQDGVTFLTLRNAYEDARTKWREKGIDLGSVVWVPEQGTWWPGRVLNRYDRDYYYHYYCLLIRLLITNTITITKTITMTMTNTIGGSKQVRPRRGAPCARRSVEG